MREELLDGLLTPEDIASRIKAASGVTIAPRTIWEKAKRLGVSKKIGRSRLIHVDDIPGLLENEQKPPKISIEASCNVGPRDSTAKALALLKERGLPKRQPKPRKTRKTDD